MPTLTVYPDADPETYTCDGYVYRYPGSPEVWNTIRTSTGTTGSAWETNAQVRIVGGAGDVKWSEFCRAILLFKISSLPTGAVIISATFNFRPGPITDNFAQLLCLVSSSPASNTDIVPADYNIANWGSTDFMTRVALSALSYHVWKSVDLNAAGIAFLQAAQAGDGIVKLGLRLSADVDNNEPTSPASGDSNLNIQTAETAYDPYLVITYSTGQTFYQTLPAIEVAALTLSKILTWGKLLSIAETSTASLLKIANYYKSLIATEVSNVILSFANTFYRALSIAETSIVSLAKKTFQILITTEVSISSLTLKTASLTLKTLEAIVTTIPVISLLKSLYRTLSATIISIATTSRLKTFCRTLAAIVISMVWLKIPIRYWNKFVKQSTTYLNKFTKQITAYTNKYSKRDTLHTDKYSKQGDSYSDKFPPKGDVYHDKYF